jgi:hypothetical protein
MRLGTPALSKGTLTDIGEGPPVRSRYPLLGTADAVLLTPCPASENVLPAEEGGFRGTGEGAPEPVLGDPETTLAD